MAWMIKWGIALGAAICVTGAQAQPLAESDLRAIDQIATEAITTMAMPGLAIAIRGPEGSITFRAYGLQKIETAEAVDETSIFRLGSISKLVTSAVVMKLVEDGKLSLDQPVREILQGKYGSNSIPVTVTLQNLLNHTSGLPDYTRQELEDGVSAGSFASDDLVSVLQRPSVSRAGEVWSYSDANYTLASIIIKHVTGLSFDDYIEQVFAPTLGLESLRACDISHSDRVTGYLATRGGFELEPAYLVRGLLGSGGLCSTASDLTQLPALLIGGSWIKPESLRLMLDSTELEGGIQVDYGMGVRGGILGDDDAWGHTGGGLHGAWATLAHYPASGYTIAVVANGTGSGVDASAIHASVARIVLKPSNLNDLKLSESDLEILSGTYLRGPQVTCILVNDGRLFRKRAQTDAPAVLLLAQDKLKFARSDYPLDRIVFQASDGPSPALLVYYDGLFAEYWVRDHTAESDFGCGAIKNVDG